MIKPENFLRTDLNRPLYYDYHLCICKREDDEPYFAMREFTSFGGWVVEEEEEDVLAFAEIDKTAKFIMKVI